VAAPLESGTVPKVVVPFLNATVPVGAPAPGATVLIVALKATLSPTVDGFLDDINVALVDALFTVCNSAAEVLRSNEESPEYTAVIEWLPAASLVVENTTLPPVTTPDPSSVVPSWNDTVPLIVPVVFEVIVAANVTACPKTDGLIEARNMVMVEAGAFIG
jgi:hypothetical protein